uniref:Uncharacterized protein n=1 Tax=Clytia hemisphaerica TaxID=252671 RepID=A0A7M5UMJ4_9CNID
MGTTYSVVYAIAYVGAREGHQYERDLKKVIEDYMEEHYGSCCGSAYQIDYHVKSQTTITDNSNGRKLRPDIVIWAKVEGEWKAVVLELKSYENTYLPSKCVDQTCRYRTNLTEFDDENCECVGAIICCRETTKMSEAFKKHAFVKDVKIRTFEPDPKNKSYEENIYHIMSTAMDMMRKN